MASVPEPNASAPELNTLASVKVIVLPEFASDSMAPWFEAANDMVRSPVLDVWTNNELLLPLALPYVQSPPPP